MGWLSRNRQPNQHVYAICSRMEAVGDVISSRYVKTIEGYRIVHFEVASSSSFGENLKKIVKVAWMDTDDSTIAIA